MKKKIITAALLSLFSINIISCGSDKAYADLAKGDKMDQEVYNFQKLMDEEKSGNKTAVFWDGEKAYTIVDDMDDFDISDGIYAREGVPLEKAMWATNIYGMEDRTVILDTDEHVIYKGDNWYFEVEIVDSFDKAYEELSNDKWMTEGPTTKEYSRKTTQFRGIKEIDGKLMAGYTACHFDGYDTNYKISYYYIGNMNEANIMKNQILGQFSINFDLDEWYQNYGNETEGDGNG